MDLGWTVGNVRFTLTADITEVRFVPIPEAAWLHSMTSSARARNIAGTSKSEGLGGLEIDDQIELGRLLYRELCWLCAAC